MERRYLQAFLNIMIAEYFSSLSSPCLNYVLDQPTSRVQIRNVPLYVINIARDDFIVPECQDFLLDVEDSLKTLKTIEEYIQRNSSRVYNERKYLIAMNREEKVCFRDRVFSFIEKVLVTKFKEEEHCYELFAHDYQRKRRDNDVMLINKWFIHNESFLSDPSNLFPGSGMKGREFYNVYVNNPPYIDIRARFGSGSEYKAMVEFARHSNMSFKGVLVDVWGDFTNDWNATPGSVKSLFLDDDVDVYYSSALLTTYSLKYASLSNPYMRMSFKCLVPEPVEANDWLLPLNIKSLKFWLLLFAVYAAFASLMFHQCHSASVSLKYLEYFGIILSQGVDERHLPRGTLMRFVFAQLFIATILFCTIYSSHLSSVITIPTYVGKIDTIVDMTTQNLKWTAPTSGYAIPMEEYNKKVYDLFFLSTKPEILDLLRARTHVGFGFIELTSRYYDLGNLNVPELAHYDVLRDDFIVDYTYFHLRKNSVLLPRMNGFLRRVVESGLHVFWETESYYTSNLLLSHARLKNGEETVLRPLDLDKLKGHFVVLLVGIVLASFRFFYEISRVGDLI